MFKPKINIVTNEVMLDTLTSMLVEGETLQTPFYALFEKKGRPKHNGFCFIGTTKSSLLLALLNTHANNVEWTSRIPLEEINKIEIKGSSFFKQIIIKIAFNEGNDVLIRASTNDLPGDIIKQSSHLSDFIGRLHAILN